MKNQAGRPRNPNNYPYLPLNVHEMDTPDLTVVIEDLEEEKKNQTNQKNLSHEAKDLGPSLKKAKRLRSDIRKHRAAAEKIDQQPEDISAITSKRSATYMN